MILNKAYKLYYPTKLINQVDRIKFVQNIFIKKKF